MGIAPQALLQQILQPVLRALGEERPAAAHLLISTAAVASDLGATLSDPDWPGLGLYRLPPASHTAVWDEYLVRDPALASTVRGWASQRTFLSDPHGELLRNFGYASAIAWLCYCRSGQPLPAVADREAQARLWAAHFPHRPDLAEADFLGAERRWRETELAARAA